MKKVSLVILTALIGSFSFAQEADSTGLEGDNLDLNGVLELFKESKDIEDFEKKLNTESNGVNNLDLNEDGEVDYIRVVDHADSNTHSLALQVPVTDSESQDIAVIEIEEVEEEKVHLQVIGDADLYGEEYMLEPADEKNASVVVNVNTWRPVRHMYGARYVAWNSPYRWGYYPKWHRPWRRAAWAVYHPRVKHYHRPYYRRATVRRCNRAHRHYHAHRAHSPHFHQNHKNHNHTKNAGLKSKNTKVVKSPNSKTGVKKTTTVKKTNNGTVQKKKTTTVVKKSPESKSGTKTVTTKKKGTQTKSTNTTKRKRPGATKQKSTRSGTQTKTRSRKGKR